MSTGNVVVSQDAPAKNNLWIQPKGTARFWNGSIWKTITGGGGSGDYLTREAADELYQSLSGMSSYLTKTEALNTYLTIEFFEHLFELHSGASGNPKINANSTITGDTSNYNIKAMFGFWTEQYISALGQNSSGGGGGGGDLDWESLVAWDEDPEHIININYLPISLNNGVITIGNNSITPLTSHQDISGKANKTITITGTNGLSGGGTLEQNRTIGIDSTYKSKIDNVLSMFELDSNGDIKTKDKPNNGGHRGFYSESFISALGANSSGSGGGGGGMSESDLWIELTDNSGWLTTDPKTIARNHLPINGASGNSGGQTFFAPVSGGDVGQFLISNGNSAPSWHTLAASDIPSLSASKITSGTLSIAQGGTGNTTGTAEYSRVLKNYYTGNTRPTSANFTHVSDGGVVHFKATSSMSTNYPGNDGHILHFNWDNSAAWDAQLFIPDNHSTSMKWRAQNSGPTWSTTWKTLIDSGNYNSYSPTLTGTGASGTWGININGNATTASKLGTSNVGSTNKPIYLNGGVATVCGVFPTLNTTGEINITNNSDLNTYTTPGMYGTSGGYGGSTTAASLLNKPTFDGGFRMSVQYGGNDNTYIRQIIYCKNGETFSREGYLSNNVWSWFDWLKILNSSNYSSYALPRYNSNLTAGYIPKLSTTGQTDLSNSIMSESGGIVTINGVLKAAGNPIIRNQFDENILHGESSATYLNYGGSARTLQLLGSPISFCYGLNEGMRLTSTGLGIGTESPAYKLDVGGKERISVNNEETALLLFTTYSNTSSKRASIEWHDYSTGSNSITGCIDTRYNGTTVDMYFGSLYNNGYNTTTRMVIKGNGNVGIGTSSPPAKLSVDGDIYASGGVTALQAVSSDKRLKKNIKKFNAKDIIDKLNPVSFEWNSKAKKLSDFKDGTNYGLIAQDSDNIIDDLVFDLPDGKGYKGVRYEKLIPILLQAVKEQQKEIDELKQIIKKLKV